MKHFKIFFLITVVAAVSMSCNKKDEDTSPTSSNPDYYFRFSFQGVQYNFENDIVQYGHLGDNELGGWGTDNNWPLGEAGKVEFRFDTAVHTLDVKAELEGKKIYFNENDGPFPLARIHYSSTSNQHYCGQGLSNSYYVEVTEVKFLGPETGLPDVNLYAIKGSFKTTLEDGNGGYADAEGIFYTQCSANVD